MRHDRSEREVGGAASPQCRRSLAQRGGERAAEAVVGVGNAHASPAERGEGLHQRVRGERVRWRDAAEAREAVGRLCADGTTWSEVLDSATWSS